MEASDPLAGGEQPYDPFEDEEQPEVTVEDVSEGPDGERLGGENPSESPPEPDPLEADAAAEAAAAAEAEPDPEAEPLTTDDQPAEPEPEPTDPAAEAEPTEVVEPEPEPTAAAEELASAPEEPDPPAEEPKEEVKPKRSSGNKTKRKKGERTTTRSYIVVECDSKGKPTGIAGEGEYGSETHAVETVFGGMEGVKKANLVAIPSRFWRMRTLEAEEELVRKTKIT